MNSEQPLIGRVTRCSTRGFVGAVRLPEPDMPAFGTFCNTEAQQGRSQVVGLIYDISIVDDEFARQMASADSLSPEQLADTQENRQVPVEYSALAVGYADGEGYRHSLPPQPPLTLAPIYPMTAEETSQFTQKLDFLPLILSAQQIPTEELLVAALRHAALLREGAAQERFLLEAGRACARLMASDLTRLDRVLQGLRA